MEATESIAKNVHVDFFKIKDFNEIKKTEMISTFCRILYFYYLQCNSLFTNAEDKLESQVLHQNNQYMSWPNLRG